MNRSGLRNWKVLAALAVGAALMWAAFPSAIGAALPLLLFAACPLGMWFMMRGMRGEQAAPTRKPASDDQTEGHEAASSRSVDELTSRLDRVHAEQNAIAAEIAALESDSVSEEAEAVLRDGPPGEDGERGEVSGETRRGRPPPNGGTEHNA
ncbi:MAG: DUF2933 domain-containing protein [Actinomycetota bacterium]